MCFFSFTICQAVSLRALKAYFCPQDTVKNYKYFHQFLLICLLEQCIKGKILVFISSLQCYSVLSDILVKNELCIPLERGSNVLSTGEGFICLSHPSKL